MHSQHMGMGGLVRGTSCSSLLDFMELLLGEFTFAHRPGQFHFADLVVVDLELEVQADALHVRVHDVRREVRGVSVP